VTTAITTTDPATETTTEVGPELAAARDERVDITWSSRSVFLTVGGKLRRQRLAHVVRDGTLLYTLSDQEEGAPSGSGSEGAHDPHDPPGRATVALFEAYPTDAGTDSPSAASPTSQAKPARDDTTIHHRGVHTSKTGRIHGTDGVLASVRDVLLGQGVREMYAQLPTGRLVVGKSAAGGVGQGELYVVTARKEASLTDAERAVREYAFVRSEFS
jgi:hypothetical protein